MRISYNWLKWYIPEAPIAEKLADVITYHIAEVESIEKREDGDSIFEIKILPNRAHDLLSHLGMGRELSSLLNIKFVDPTPMYKIPKSAPTSLIKEIKTPKCRRYMGRIIRNIKIGLSPDWVVKHLESIGQRSINNIVDATNLVMFDCGQPTHVFDLKKVKDLKLQVRNAAEGEKIILLGGEEKALNDSMMVIADGEGNSLDIAGIKGGKYAELTTHTTDIILEAANFDPVSVRRTAQALNIMTDAKKRFENDLSPELASYAMRELSALILEMCPDAIFEDIVDIYPKKQEERKVSFGVEKISKILGLEVSNSEVEDILKRYNIEFRSLPNPPLDKRREEVGFKEEEKGGVFEIAVPLMRLDLLIEEDIAEEIGRILGYDKVKEKIPKINFKSKINEIYAKIYWARNKLLDGGYSEVMTYVFKNKGEVEVLASASDKKALRTDLSDGLKESLKLNQINAPLLGLDEIKIFEIGTVFRKDSEQINVCYGDKKGITEVSLDEFCKEDKLSGFFLEPRAYSLVPVFKMWSLFPFIARDIAVWVPENTSSGDVAKIITENMGKLVIKGPELFDSFVKGSQTSYAFRLVFQSYERTLTDTEVNEIISKITEKLKAKSGWHVR